MGTRTISVAMVLMAMALLLVAAEAAVAYDREAAKDYAQAHALTYSSNYKSFSETTGDCANFVSQCIHEGGVAMSHSDPYWRNFKNQNNAWVVSNSWSVAYNLFDYWKTSPRSNYRSLVDTWDWLSSTSRPAPPNNIPGVVRGDFLSYVTGDANNEAGFQNDWNDIDHSAIVTGLNSHPTTQGATDMQGTLVCQHTTDRYRVFWTAEDRLPAQEFRKWGYVCWRLSTSAF